MQRKWWGSKGQRPILCVHGWQDNANTFNTLIPQLSTDYSYLAIDLPGHGLSSHLPKGLFYRIYNVASVFRRIQLYFEWPKVSLIGHSYGATCSFLFSSCFPDAVDFFIAIDTLKPHSVDIVKEHGKSSAKIEKLLFYDSLTPEQAPAYTEQDLLQRWIKGSKNSLTEKSCQILMQRGTQKGANGLFQLNRDCRVKECLFSDFSQKENLKLAEALKCNVLFLKAKDSPYFENKENVFDVMKVIQNNVKHFENHELPGTHHLHLNNPEIVAPVINSFIKKIGGQE